MLIYIRHLELYDCEYILDISQLKKLETLILYKSNISNINMLTNITKLVLKKCQRISDISNLKKIGYLKLYSCNNIVDISMLHKLHYLDIKYCYSLNIYPSYINRINTVFYFNNMII